MKLGEAKRLIRPVERQPMREWLIGHLDDQDVQGCEWMDRQDGKFRIKWCHGSRHGWSIKEVELFEKWAKHTGRYDVNNKDPKKWKANFRCALNSRKDIEELTKKEQLRGNSAYRIYRMKGQVVRAKTTKSPRVPETTPELNEEDINTQGPTHQTCPDELYQRLNNAVRTTANVKKFSQLPKFEQILPNFEKLEYGKMHVLPRHGSGFRVEVLKPATLLEQIPSISGPVPTTFDMKPDISITPSLPSTHTSYPPTPEESEASQVSDEEDMEFLVEVSQEVTVESTEFDESTSYVITDISNTSQYQPHTAFSPTGQRPFCPLTPP